MLNASWILFTSHLGLVLRSKRALIGALLAFSPVLVSLIIAWNAGASESPPVLVIAWTLTLQTIVPLVALIFGVAVVGGEVDDRTITYLFTRPIPRPAILIGRYLATLVPVLGLLSIGTGASLVVLRNLSSPEAEAVLSGSQELRIVFAAAAGAATYLAIFSAAGALLKRPMIAGLAYTFAIEGFVGLLPGQTRSLTVQHHLRTLVADADPGLWKAMDGSSMTNMSSAGDAAGVLLMIVIVSLAVGSWAISRKQYLLGD